MKILSLMTALGVMCVASSTFAESKKIASTQAQGDQTQFSYLLAPDADVMLADVGAVVASKSHYQTVYGYGLKKGIGVATDGDEAIVQLTLIPGRLGKAGIQTSMMPSHLTIANGVKAMNAKDEAMALMADAPKLYSGTRVFKVAKELGAGELKLSSLSWVNPSDRFVLYVLDKNSDTRLNLASNRMSLAGGERLKVSTFLDGLNSQLLSTRAKLKAPDGRSYIVQGKTQGNQFDAYYDLNLDAQRKPGELWQLEVVSQYKSQRGHRVTRTASVALDVHQASAKLVSIDQSSGQLAAHLQVEQTGRYEVRAYVYGRNNLGLKTPALVSYTAENLDTGSQLMPLNIDFKQLAASGLQAPFTIEGVQLLDQGQMAVLATEQKAITLH